MVCETVILPGGGTAIICGMKQARHKCRCGRTATLLCDWKIPGAEEYALVKKGTVSGTCDAPLCDRCTHSPAPDKDLCPKHAAQWAERLPTRAVGDRGVSHISSERRIGAPPGSAADVSLVNARWIVPPGRPLTATFRTKGENSKSEQGRRNRD